MRSQQIASNDGGLPDARGQRLRLHAVLNTQHALLEQLARFLVASLGGIGRDGAGLLRKCKVRIARTVGGLHCGVARQRGGNSKFLLGPVNVCDTVTGRRLD